MKFHPPPLPLRDPACTNCGLHATAKTVCVGYRSSREVSFTPTAPVKILFVGEAPGPTEDKVGRPFVGAAGKLLDEAIREYRIKNYAITNAVKCFPQKSPGEIRKPHKKEVAACKDYLDAEILALKPEIVVPLGAAALEAMTGLKKITDWAGRVLPENGKPYKVFPIIHPAAVLRASDRWLAPFEAQFKGLARLASGKAPTPTNYVKVTLDEACERLQEIAKKEGIFAIDFETGGKGKRAATNPKVGYLVTAAVSTAPGEAFWWEWPRTPDETLCLALAEACMTGTMVAHNATFEVKWLLWHVFRNCHGFAENLGEIEWRIADTMLLYYLLHEDAKGSYGLEHLARELTDMGGYDDAMQGLLASGKQHHEVDIDVLGAYNAADADCTLRCYNVLKPEVKKDADLWSVWTNILRPAVFSVAHCELNGRKVSWENVATVRAELKAQMKTGLKRFVSDPATNRFIETLPPGKFNPNGRLQVGKILFDYARVPVIGETDGGGRSIAEKFLEPFRERFPLIDGYLDWKVAHTLLNNYLDPYTRLVEADDFLYGGYLLHGAATGRLASVSPNLQNFHEWLRRIVVSMFGEDGCIVEADYSQNELRLMAWAADCAPLLEAYRKGQDVHRLTASKVLGKPMADITKDERQNKGKRPNFALLYGAMPKRFHIEFGVPLDEATDLYHKWHRAYPEIGKYHERIHRAVARTGVVRSALGRVRRLPAAIGPYYSPAERRRNRSLPFDMNQILAFLAASNHPVSSLSSDLNTIAFSEVRRAIAKAGLGVKILGATHDSGTYDCPRNEIADFVPILRRCMVEEMHARFPWLGVPLEIEVKAGPTWGSLEPWPPPVKNPAA